MLQTMFFIKLEQKHKMGNKAKTVLVPDYSEHYIIVASSLRAFGIHAKMLRFSEENLKFGKRHLLGKECFACNIATSSLLNECQKRRINLNNTLFLTTRLGGPCRVGQYMPLQKMLIKEISGEDSFFCKLPSGFQEMPEIFKHIDIREFERLIIEGMAALDMVIKALHEVRPYEKKKGEADFVYQKCKKRICREVESRGDFVEIMKTFRQKFEQIEIDRTIKKPLIGITGQLFYIYNKIANNNIIEKLENLGAEVLTPIAVELPIYELYAVLSILKLKRRASEASFFQNLINIHEQQVKEIIDAWGDFYRTPPNPSIKEIIDSSGEYIDPSVLIETTLSIGKTKAFIEQGVNGIVLTKSFSCMPGTISESIIGKRLKTDLGNFPFLSLAYDALEETNIQTRLEAFVYQAKQYGNLKKVNRGRGNDRSIY